jgi:hypothetical protein
VKDFPKHCVKKQKHNPSLTHFEVALIKTVGDQRQEDTGDNHNPTRQRGIFPHTASTAKAQSLAHAAGWDRRKRATSKLTQRVGMAANAQLQNRRMKSTGCKTQRAALAVVEYSCPNSLG